jgi:hypothetical protein
VRPVVPNAEDSGRFCQEAMLPVLVMVAAFSRFNRRGDAALMWQLLSGSFTACPVSCGGTRKPGLAVGAG